MFKIILALLLMTVPAWSQQWRGGTGENTLLGSSQAALIGTNSFSKIVQPLDSLLATYCNQYLQYTSSSTLTISSGSVMVSNSQGTIRLMLQNTSATVLTSANLDTGSLTASTTYYVYAVGATSSATSATYLISANNTAPSGATYYYQIGNFTTDSNTQITGIINNWVYGGYVIGPPSSKSADVIYQALTDGFLIGTSDCAGNAARQFEILSDSNVTPVLALTSCTSGSSTTELSIPQSALIRKGDYYEVKHTAGSQPITIFWIPYGK